MDNPTFRLEGVVRVRDETEDFEGPLTLILQLLSKNKIEIQDIKISSLLDQYMAYLDKMKAMDLEIASEFVVMASHLVYIKARMLLSAGEEPDELEELKESLEKLRRRDIYEQVKSVTGKLSEMYRRGAGAYAKPPEPMPQRREYRYVHDKKDIFEAMLRALSHEDAPAIPAGNPFAMPRRIVYSVSEKTEEIIRRLRGSGPTSVGDLLEDSRSRTELVATFIALLELCRDGRIRLSGSGSDTVASEFA